MKTVTLVPRSAELAEAARLTAQWSGARIEWRTPDAGQVVGTLRGTRVGLVAGDLDFTLRRELGLTAGIRLFRAFEGLKLPVTFMDLAVIHELGARHDPASSRRLAELAFTWAATHARQKITLIEGPEVAFLRTCRDIAADFPQLVCEEETLDDVLDVLAAGPEEFDVILCPSPYAVAVMEQGLRNVGGATVVPAVELGEDAAVFGSRHPIALVLSLAMLLDHINEGPPGDRIVKAVKKLLWDRDAMTPDLGGPALLREMTEEFCRLLDQR